MVELLGDKGEKRAGWKSLGKPLYGHVRGTVYGSQSTNFTLEILNFKT